MLNKPKMPSHVAMAFCIVWPAFEILNQIFAVQGFGKTNNRGTIAKATSTERKLYPMNCRPKDGIFSISILFFAFFLNIILKSIFRTESLIPLVFVLGVFLIALKTQGYFWGISSSLISVLAVNYAFTYPYYAFDLISPECLASAVVMLIVTIMTGTLTTKIKQHEKIKAENEIERLRTGLLRAVSHDLRTPLTSIYGLCSVLQENYDALDREQQKIMLEEIKKDADWLVRMVENLLSVTRFDNENVILKKNPVVLEELIDAVLVKFQKHYPQQSVMVDIPEDFISIPMDAMLIEQVIVNLLENAIYHAKDMTLLELSVKLTDTQAVFMVCDDGCGIPEERIPSLFTLYGNISDSTTDRTRRNMGIGLSVCAAIVKAHGGEIFAYNNPDRGATFCFALSLT